MLSETAMWWVAGLLTLGCALLLRYAFFGRRIGDTPFCRKCRYNLTGVTIDDAGARCPECGVDLSKLTPHSGTRPRRPIVAAGAIALALLATCTIGVGLWQWLSKIQLVQYLPERWLVERVEAGGSETAEALTELQRRHRVPTLSRNTIQRLIEGGLTAQGRETLLRTDPIVFENLSLYSERGYLSQAQFDRLVRQSVRPRAMRTRPRLVQGRPFRLEAEFELRILSAVSVDVGPMRVHCDEVELAAVPHVSPTHRMKFAGAAASSHSVEADYIMNAPLGAHSICCSVSFEITGVGAPQPGGRVESEVSCQVEVVAVQPPDAVRAVVDAALDEDVRDRITIACFGGGRGGSSDAGTRDPERPIDQRLMATLRGRPNVNLFLVPVAEINGNLHRLPFSISFDPAKNPTSISSSWTLFTSHSFDRVYLIANPQLAYEGSLFSAYWEGTLVFEQFGRMAGPNMASDVGETAKSLRMEAAWPMDLVTTLPTLDPFAPTAPITTPASAPSTTP
ncbi:MAG: hypothetical protein SF069_01080 [Phycisphaerae bacterium]|nr:hypothetical protein [Phycisphaerae bacterium]